MVAPGASPDELPIDVELIKVLASDSRRDILRMLGERRKTLTELAEAMGLKKATVLEHLQKLVEAGLIRKLDEGERLWIYYELTPRGKRLVRPERTRFYLILASTAAAALLLGVVLAFSVFSQMGDLASSDSLSSSDSSAKSFKDLSSEASPRIAWRGLDEGVDLRFPSAPADTTLVLRGSDGAARPVELRDGVATLDATALDALAPDAYALSLSGLAGESVLGETLWVRDPAIAAFPRVVVDGENATIELALVPPGQSAPVNATVLLGAVEHHLVSQSVAFLSLSPEGDAATLRVGRLFASEIAVTPAFALDLANVNGSLRILATDEGAPLVGAIITLDSAPLGRTDAEGALVAGWPAPGDRALRIVAADGRALERGVGFGDTAVVDLPPVVRLEAFDARLPGLAGMRVRVDVFNDGPAEAIVTVAAREGGSLLASALARVPAGGRSEVLLASSLATPGVIDITAHSARTSVTTEAQFTETAPAMVATGATPPGAAEPESDGARYGLYDASTEGADARTTLVLSREAGPTTSPAAMEGQSAPAVPGVSPILVVALVAIAAFALRPRRR